MKKLTFTLLGMLVFYQLAFNQNISSQSQIHESLSFGSEILKKEVRYSVYLPNDYETSSRNYPVLYLLHGGSGNETDWLVRGNMQYIVDKAIEKGEIPRMLVVMPSSLNSHYINNCDGSLLYENMFINEFIPFIESKYRIRKDRDSRAIGGLSRGGYGALLYAMNHPQLFKACLALSSAIRTDEDYNKIENESWLKTFRPLFGIGKNNSRISESWEKNNPLYIVASKPADSLRMVHFLIDCGDKDYLVNGNMALHKALNDIDIPHEFRIKKGSHTWDYWRQGLADGLGFIGFYLMGGW